MNHKINITLFGFYLGKYTYFFKKKKLYRFNPKNGSILLLREQLKGGSLCYWIQGDLYKKNDFVKVVEKVTIHEYIPF